MFYQETLSETKNVPACETVMKQQCDSRWEVNQQGQKVSGDFFSNYLCLKL